MKRGIECYTLIRGKVDYGYKLTTLGNITNYQVDPCRWKQGVPREKRVAKTRELSLCTSSFFHYYSRDHAGLTAGQAITLALTRDDGAFIRSYDDDPPTFNLWLVKAEGTILHWEHKSGSTRMTLVRQIPVTWQMLRRAERNSLLALRSISYAGARSWCRDTKRITYNP